MKTMTCYQLGGACDKKFSANTFEDIAELSKKHAMEMFQKGDEPHLSAIYKMQELMKNPEAMTEWFQKIRDEYNALPNE